jgi:hypothetical protein
VIQNILKIPQRARFQISLALAVVADALQIAVFPLFAEGAASPADDVLDCAVGAALTLLLGWHWEFAPSFVGKLIPGVDLAPFWTIAVANVYRKSKRIEAAPDENRQVPPTLPATNPNRETPR